MDILVVGLNHNTAPVEVREKLAFGGPKLEEGLSAIHSLDEINEAVVLSTCNRVEIYTCVNDTGRASEAIKTFISSFHGIERGLLKESLYFHSGPAGVLHSFRVAASLDSMIVGEAQILGQLKEAFEFSLERKATGVMLNKLMKKSISVAKRVRTETRIAESAVNISSAAVDLARKIFTHLEEKSVLLLGAGDMAELAAKHLMSGGVRDVAVANRTYETGCALAEQMGGRAVEFALFPQEMERSDIVICSTGAPEYVVGKGLMHDVMKARKQKPVFIIDISVPRNIDPEINKLENVYLYDVDDLRGVADAGLEERKKEAAKGESIVAEEVETFLRWRASLDAVPTIVALRERAEQVKRDELDKALSRMPDLGEREKKLMEQVAASIVNKLIHPPTAALKQDAEDKDELVATIKRLYGIEPQGPDRG
jgi:glutamyl-tRNA reductase